jgi:hypothetical protein
MAKECTKKSQKYKYKIHDHLAELPYNQFKKVKKVLPEALGVNRRTFYRWLNVKEGDKTEIPSDKLALIAKLLNKPIEKMFNYTIPKINIETLHYVNESDVLDDFNLSKRK